MRVWLLVFSMEPETLCGARGGSIVFRNSLGFRAVGVSGWIIARSETFNVQFSGSVRGGVYGYAETFAPLCLGGTWRGRFAWWKPRLCAFVELRGCFRGIWKLERLVWVRKNLGLWRGWKLGVCFLE